MTDTTDAATGLLPTWAAKLRAGDRIEEAEMVVLDLADRHGSDCYCDRCRDAAAALGAALDAPYDEWE